MNSFRHTLALGPFVVLAIGWNSFVSSSGGAAIESDKLSPPATRKVDFAKDIQPIFADHCYQCHGPKKQEATLRFDQKTSALKGAESGPVILAGKSAESLLVHAVSWVREDLK